MAESIPEVLIVNTYNDPHLAHLDRAKLTDEGIESFIRDENIVTITPYLANAVGSVKLFVAAEDIARARAVLALDESELLRATVDGEYDGPTKCPACGSTNTIQRKSFLVGLLFLFLFFLPVTLPNQKVLCAECGHKWRQRETK
jgi:hypothetical protein